MLNTKYTEEHPKDMNRASVNALLKNSLNNNIKKDDQVIQIGGGLPLTYYSKIKVPTLNGNMMTLKQMMIHENGRIWLIVSPPQVYKKKGEEVIQWMNENYKIISQKKYYRDSDYIRKSKFFKKDFLEYRIKVYLYGPKNYK